MDLAQFAGLDYVDVTLAGQLYRVGDLTLREWAPVQAWIKATVPGPLSSLGSPDFRKLPPEVKRELLAEALEQDRTSWPPRVGSKPWFFALDAEGGHAVLLLALLGKYQPIDLAKCQAIVEAVTFEEILPCVLAGLGLFGPKSPAPAAAAETTMSPAPGATVAMTSATSRTSSPRRGAGRKTMSSASR